MASAATACRGLSRCNRRQRISGSSSTPTVQFEECPCCGQRLRASKRAKRHLAFCAPDLLDGEEWAKRGIPAMESHLTRKYNDRHRARRAVEYRFGLMQAGQEKIIPASEISRKLDLPKQAVTKFIRREVRNDSSFLSFASGSHRTYSFLGRAGSGPGLAPQWPWRRGRRWPRGGVRGRVPLGSEQAAEREVLPLNEAFWRWCCQFGCVSARLRTVPLPPPG